MNITMINIPLFILLVIIEILIAIVFKNTFLSYIPSLKTAPTTTWDNYIINILSSVIFAIIQYINLMILLIQDKSIKKLEYIVFAKYKNMGFSYISKIIKNMSAFVLSTNVYWGVTYKTNVLKVANTAEGLLALAYAYENGVDLSDSHLYDLRKIADRLIAECDTNGYKSYNINGYTVHCTGMALCAIKKLIDFDLYSIDDKTYEIIRKCLRHLLETASDYGWGLENTLYDDKDLIRIFSTLWALRALNAWDFYKNEKFIRVISNLINEFQNSLLGFSFHTEAKSSMVSLFLILYSEINDKKSKKSLRRLVSDSMMSDMIKYVINNLHNSIEVEEFMQNKIEFRKLSWTHIAVGLNICALSINMNALDKIHFYKLLSCVADLLRHIDIKRGYYFCSQLNFNHDDPLFYPTTYIIIALCEFMNNLVVNNFIKADNNEH